MYNRNVFIYNNNVFIWNPFALNGEIYQFRKNIIFFIYKSKLLLGICRIQGIFHYVNNLFEFSDLLDLPRPPRSARTCTAIHFHLTI